jgi:hypothetical protein
VRKTQQARLGIVLAIAVWAAGCSGRSSAVLPVAPAVEAPSLAKPMAQVMEQLQVIQKEAGAGRSAEARAAYQALAVPLGQVLGPVSLQDVQVAQQMANANMALREALAASRPDPGVVAGCARGMLTAVQEAAARMGLTGVTADMLK